MVSSIFVHSDFYFPSLFLSHSLHPVSDPLELGSGDEQSETNASQHLGLLCVRSPSVMSRFCGPFTYLPICSSLMWEMSPLVGLL